MDKVRVAEIIAGFGTLLELRGENPFKTRAYANAARALETMDEPLDRVIAEDRLGEVKGIGESLQEKIRELVATGRLAAYEELKAATPPGLLAMLEIPGLGPKKVAALHRELALATVEQLEEACRDGRVAGLSGFGAKTAANIIEGIQRRRQYASQHLLSEVLPVVGELLEALRAHPDVIRCAIAGSSRRHKEVVGDADLLASSRVPGQVLADFVSWPGVERVLARGETKASVLLAGGLQCDLRVVADVDYAPALMYFTGSKAHNIVMRQRAIDRGLRLNEYGLFRSDSETRDPALRLDCRTEEEVFQHLGLAYIPPELREDMGEFAAAAGGPLPRLLEWTDLKGSLHNHSTWSDGRQTIPEIARSMEDLGLAYWAITDHSKSSFQANGLDVDRILRQGDEIRGVNERLAAEGSEFRLLSGVEVDILTDGSLDLPDEVLAGLDVVVASIHQSFTQSEEETTRRLISAARNPWVTMLGHLTGRLLLQREPYQVDQRAVIDVCAETGTWIELNSSPSRFDLDWRLWPYARGKGVKCCVNCDAHRLEHVGYLRLGAGMARKGWLHAGDVMNTLGLPALRVALAAKRGRLAAEPKGAA